MRTAGLAIFVALYARHTSAIYGGITCNTEALLTGASVTSFLAIQGLVLKTVSLVCETPPGVSGTISKQLGDLVLELHRGEAVQDVNECQAYFANIISQCIRSVKASGGEFHTAQGVVYTALLSDSDGHNARYPRSPTSARPTPVKPIPGKPAPAKPAPVKSQPTPAKPSPSLSQSNIVKIGSIKDCKQLALLMRNPDKGLKVTRDDEKARGGFVGSRVSTISTEGLARRASDEDDWYEPSARDTKINHEGTAKRGSSCGMVFDALDYPKAKSMVCVISCIVLSYDIFFN